MISLDVASNVRTDFFPNKGNCAVGMFVTSVGSGKTHKRLQFRD